MNIDLDPEDQQLVDGLIAQGRFSSPSDVIRSSLLLLQAETDWKDYARQRIDAGVQASANSDFAPEEEMDRLFATYRRKSA